MSLRERVLRWAIRKYLRNQNSSGIIKILWAECQEFWYEDNVATRREHLKNHIDQEADYELWLNSKRY